MSALLLMAKMNVRGQDIRWMWNDIHNEAGCYTKGV